MLAPPPQPPAALSRPTPVQILNNFTWPNPAQPFAFDADADETGDDLKRRLAAHIGYLALDIVLVRTKGGALDGASRLGEQGLSAGESIRLARKSCLPVGAGACECSVPWSLPGVSSHQRTTALAALSAAALAPSSATLERYCHSAFVLSCVEVLPGAPVLLRMLMLDHGYLPHLRARTALQHAIPAAGLSALLKAMGALPPPDDVAIIADVATSNSSAKSDEGGVPSDVANHNKNSRGTSPHPSETEQLAEKAALAAAGAAAAVVLAEAPLASIVPAVKRASSNAANAARANAAARAAAAAA